MAKVLRFELSLKVLETRVLAFKHYTPILLIYLFFLIIFHSSFLMNVSHAFNAASALSRSGSFGTQSESIPLALVVLSS